MKRKQSDNAYSQRSLGRPRENQLDISKDSSFEKMLKFYEK